MHVDGVYQWRDVATLTLTEQRLGRHRRKPFGEPKSVGLAASAELRLLPPTRCIIIRAS
jgi:hypothetical protein